MQDLDPSSPSRRALLIGYGGLAVALAALVARYVSVATSSFSYDEATYVELARHPWRSSYYPDAVFARHPPLAFMLLGIWTALFGEAEWVARLLGLVLSLGATLLAWRAVVTSRGPILGGFAAILVGAGFLALVYGVQATLYPLAFLAATWLGVATMRGDRIAQRNAIAVLALTHLFGFVLLGFWAWRHRAEWRRHTPILGVPVLWAFIAAILVLTLRNDAGPGWGPLWQPTRVFEFPYQLLVGDTSFGLHFLAFMVILCQLQVPLWPGVFARRLREPVPLGILVLIVFLFTGPTFLRFGLIVAPLVVLLGIQGLDRPGRAFRVAGYFVVGLVLGASFLGSGFDVRAQNDVPGLADWRGAADWFAARNETTVIGAAPTAIAFYLGSRHGGVVLDSRDGPDLLPMRISDRDVRVRILPPNATIAIEDPTRSVVAVEEDRPPLSLGGLRECARVEGLRLFCSA